MASLSRSTVQEHVAAGKNTKERRLYHEEVGAVAAQAVHTRLLDAAGTGAEAALAEAARILRAGGLVAFPTETVYGLGADATNPEAVQRIYAAKGRPSDNPMIVHIADPADLPARVAAVPAVAGRLIARFWPGPLTLVFPRSPLIPDVVTGGLDTVAVRIPDHPVALRLIALAGVPIAAPSANLSGRPSPTTAQHVWDDLQGRVEAIVDGGETGVGLESTVLDVTRQPPVLLRPGGVTVAQLRQVVGPVRVDPAVRGQETLRPLAPGMKYAHYAPRAPLYLVEGAPSAMREKITSLIYELEEEGKRVGVMHAAESRGAYRAPVVLEVGSRHDLRAVASALFSLLRAFDLHGVDAIVAEGLPEEGIGLAVMNRLRKAAAGRIIKV